MKALTCWIDESEIVHDGTRTWIIGQLITTSDAEQFDLLRNLCAAHGTARTWDTLHANEFSKTDSRKWALLEEWIRIFKADPNTYFHALVFDEDSWRNRYATAHHYWAHQIFFGLGNKMKEAGIKIQTMFSDVSTITAIMDRKATVTGHIVHTEGGVVGIERVSALEGIYEARMLAALIRQSKKSAGNLSLRFSFANSRCFDGLQLCDCLTYMVRQRFLHETGLGDIAQDFLDLWNAEFLTSKMFCLNDFGFYEKFNYFKIRPNRISP